MPCHTIFQKSLSKIWLTQRYAPDTVDIYRYMPFALPDTVTDTINLFTVLLSPVFTCLGKNNLTSDIVYMLPFYALIQWRFNLYTAHHAVCALNYFSLSDTANSYFSPRGSSPVWDFTLQVVHIVLCKHFIRIYWHYLMKRCPCWTGVFISIPIPGFGDFVLIFKDSSGDF